MDGRVKPGHDENASGSIVEFRDRCPVTGFKHASLRRRGRFLIRLYAGELAIERRSAIDIGTFVPRRKHACAPATSVENKNTENAGRDTLDDQHRLKRTGLEQGEQEFSYGRDIVAGDDKALGGAFGHPQAINRLAGAGVILPIIQIRTLHQFRRGKIGAAQFRIRPGQRGRIIAQGLPFLIRRRPVLDAAQGGDRSDPRQQRAHRAVKVETAAQGDDKP